MPGLTMSENFTRENTENYKLEALQILTQQHITQKSHFHGQRFIHFMKYLSAALTITMDSPLKWYKQD